MLVKQDSNSLLSQVLGIHETVPPLKQEEAQ